MSRLSPVRGIPRLQTNLLLMSSVPFQTEKTSSTGYHHDSHMDACRYYHRLMNGARTRPLS